MWARSLVGVVVVGLHVEADCSVALRPVHATTPTTTLNRSTSTRTRTSFLSQTPSPHTLLSHLPYTSPTTPPHSPIVLSPTISRRCAGGLPPTITQDRPVQQQRYVLPPAHLHHSTADVRRPQLCHGIDGIVSAARIVYAVVRREDCLGPTHHGYAQPCEVCKSVYRRTTTSPSYPRR